MIRVVPVLGIEHKAVAAVDSAARRWCGEVDPSHFAQACHYAMLLDIPYTLIYTFNGQGSAPFLSLIHI